PASTARAGTNAKVTVSGSIELGDVLELQQRAAPTLDTGFRFSSAVPSDGVLRAVDQTDVAMNASAMPAEQLGWGLQPAKRKLAIVNKGLTESYMIFGGPGSGKTYLLMYLLRQMFALGSDDPQRKVGALILDPKAVLIDDVRKMLAIAGRLDDLVILNADEL